MSEKGDDVLFKGILTLSEPVNGLFGVEVTKQGIRIKSVTKRGGEKLAKLRDEVRAQSHLGYEEDPDSTAARPKLKSLVIYLGSDKLG